MHCQIDGGRHPAITIALMTCAEINKNKVLTNLQIYLAMGEKLSVKRWYQFVEWIMRKCICWTGQGLRTDGQRRQQYHITTA